MIDFGARGRPTVLITGAGAPPGMSIFKALRHSKLDPRIVATDADPRSVGLFRADAAYVIPKCTEGEARYLSALRDICLREQVALVCFGSEIEMRRAAPHLLAFEAETRARLVLNEPPALERFMDKWGTACALRELDLPAPETALASDAESVEKLLERHGYPAIVKPRRGSGSKNLFLARDAEELRFFAAYVPEAVVQEYLLPDDEEYTVGLYKSPRQGYLGQIVFRRMLAAGLTYRAEVVLDAEIEAECRRVAERIEVWGPINLQLRKTAKGVRIFEINLRFSSSEVMRAHFGFNAPEMCLRELVYEETLAPPEIRPGLALRYWNEVILEPEDYGAPAAGGWSGLPRGKVLRDL